MPQVSMRFCDAKSLADPQRMSSPDAFLLPQREIKGINANP